MARGFSVAVDREVCIGSGMCVAYAPGTFGQDEDAKSVVHVLPDTLTDEIRSAVEACPMGALTLVENGPDQIETGA